MMPSVLQVSSADVGGGAEAVALGLHRTFRSRGVPAVLAVGIRRGDDEGVVAIGRWRSRRARALRDPAVVADVLRGREDFRFPASRRVLDLALGRPDVLHLHNLHGEYFDLRALPQVAAGQPTVVTMHDEWLYTGHCACTLGCERWESSCGSCPHLDVYPALRVDGTASNRARKADLYAGSRLHVVAPSEWLLERAGRSILAAGMASARVIRNGVDLRQFTPGDRVAARAQLGLPPNAQVLLFAAPGVRTNPFRDFATLEAALAVVGSRAHDPVVAVALGEAGGERAFGSVRLQSLPFTTRDTVARYLQAADLYVHPAKADTHPVAVLEALAAGVPVVASHVGGIPEEIGSETGVLVPPGDPQALAGALGELLADDERRARMGRAAVADARARFDLERQADAYLDLYAELACT
jgi:glycosyltransferase involved in cell wall biosynthesis